MGADQCADGDESCKATATASLLQAKSHMSMSEKNNPCMSTKGKEFWANTTECEYTDVLPSGLALIRERPPYVVCTHTQPVPGICGLWVDDRCRAKALAKDWCCDEDYKFHSRDGKPSDHWKRKAQVSEGGACIGCHIKYGGQHTAPNNQIIKVPPKNLDARPNAMEAFTCVDDKDSANTGKWARIVYLRPFDSTDDDGFVTPQVVTRIASKECGTQQTCN